MKKIMISFLCFAVFPAGAFAQRVVPSKKIDVEQYQTKREIIHQVQTQWKENDVLHRLQALRTVCQQSKKHDPELILKAGDFLYEGMLARFGQAGYGGFAVQRDEREAREICTEIEKPIHAGWGGYVVLSQYIGAQLEQAAAWCTPEQLEALDTFAAWLNKYGQYQVWSVSKQSWRALLEVQGFRHLLAELKRENIPLVLEKAEKLNTTFMGIARKSDVVQLAKLLNEPIKTSWRGEIKVSEYVEDVAREAEGVGGRDGARNLAEFIGHVLD